MRNPAQCLEWCEQSADAVELVFPLTARKGVRVSPEGPAQGLILKVFVSQISVLGQSWSRMLIHERRTSHSVIERGLSSSLDLYVDLGIRPSSLTLFSDLGIDLYVELPIKSQTSDGHGDGGKQSSKEIWREDEDHVREHFDPSASLNVDDPKASVRQIESTAAILDHGLTTINVVVETYTDEDVESDDVAESFIGTDGRNVNIVETFTGTDGENVNVGETFTGTDVENVDAEPFTDTDVENVDVISLLNVESAAYSLSQKTGDERHVSKVRSSELVALARENWSWKSVDTDVASEEDVLDDAEIGAIHGLTKLRNEFRLQRCNSGEATFSNLESIKPSSDRMRESATFPDEELYHLRIHLEYLSKRVRKPNPAPDIKNMKSWKINVCKDEKMCKPKRIKPLSLKSRNRDCECMSRSLQRAYRSVRTYL